MEKYWPKDLITEFIEVYRANPSLWKIKSQDYKNKFLKNSAYDQLVEVCKKTFPGVNREMVTKKIQSMRASFRKELKKIEESSRSGASQDDVYTPTLWYFDLLLFTKDHEIPSLSKDSITEDSWDEDKIQTETAKSDVHPQESPGECSSRENGNIENKHFAQRKMKRTNTSLANEKIKFMKTCEKALQEDTRASINEYDAVAINVGAKLQKMDAMQALYAEMLIHKVLMNGLMGKLTENADLIIPAESGVRIHENILISPAFQNAPSDPGNLTENADLIIPAESGVRIHENILISPAFQNEPSDPAPITHFYNNWDPNSRIDHEEEI